MSAASTFRSTCSTVTWIDESTGRFKLAPQCVEDVVRRKLGARDEERIAIVAHRGAGEPRHGIGLDAPERLDVGRVEAREAPDAYASIGEEGFELLVHGLEVRRHERDVRRLLLPAAQGPWNARS